MSIKLRSDFIETTLWHGCSLVNMLRIFRRTFPKNTYVGLLLSIDWFCINRWLVLRFPEIPEYFEFPSSHPICSLKKCVLKTFATFTKKQLCQRLFLEIELESLKSPHWKPKKYALSIKVTGSHLAKIHYKVLWQKLYSNREIIVKQC